MGQGQRPPGLSQCYHAIFSRTLWDRAKGVLTGSSVTMLSSVGSCGTGPKACWPVPALLYHLQQIPVEQGQRPVGLFQRYHAIFSRFLWDRAKGLLACSSVTMPSSVESCGTGPKACWPVPTLPCHLQQNPVEQGQRPVGLFQRYHAIFSRILWNRAKGLLACSSVTMPSSVESCGTGPKACPSLALPCFLQLNFNCYPAHSWTD